MKLEAPKRIYLQNYFEDFGFYDEGCTWCEDKQNENDLEYILQSEYDKLEKENTILKEKANGLYLLLVDNPETRKLADKHIELVEMLYRDTSGEG